MKPQVRRIEYKLHPTSNIIFGEETAFYGYTEKAIEDKISKTFGGYIVENILTLRSRLE
ncbi:MAG: hypothetical protein QW279_11740 [Candidatus Jordarchaeaceae archaeon]